MYAITGASGQLGKLVLDRLLAKAPASEVVATVRNLDDGAALADRGVTVRVGDYDKPETLAAAFAGVNKLLLISSSEVGKRTPQHRAVIDAAKAAGVEFIAYTSVLHADSSPLGMAGEHRETEAALAASGVPYALLRNGWYNENHLAGLPAVLQHDALLGSAKNGRISSAARADFADAAVAVLTADDQAGKVYELAGDDAWSLPELAAEIGSQAGRTIAYQDMPEEAYAGVLKQAGLPDPLAELYADSDVGASNGALFDDGHALSRLIGHPTTPIARSITDALAKQG